MPHRGNLSTDGGEAPIVKASARSESSHTKGHVVFVSRQRIAGRTNGSSAYVLDLASAVRRAGFTPHLVQPSPDLLGRWPVMILRPETSVFESHAIRGVLRLGPLVISRDPRVGLGALRALASRLGRRIGLTGEWLADRPRPYAVADRWTAADRAYVQRRVSGFADIMIADYAFQAEALDLCAGRPSAIVMHDLFHARTAGAEGRDSVASLDRDAEVALLSRADAVIAIQAAEARFVADYVAARAILAPMAAQPVARPQPGDGNRLLFVGSNTAPNVVGLEWLFAHVWPALRRQAPSIMLDVVGSVALGFTTGGAPGVVFHGQVDAVEPYYARAGIVLSPLTFGSGLKIKLVEALAQGKAIVATGVTLQGVERECEGCVIRADDPDDFVAAILALADDRRRASLAAVALETAKRHFSPEACHAQFTAWLEENRPSAIRRDRCV